MRQRVTVVVAATAPTRVDEALRAAIGLTLRGAAVEVYVDPASLTTDLARRASAALTSFGHHVGAARAPLADAEVVEIWTDEAAASANLPPLQARPARRVLHLVRRGATPMQAHAADWIVELAEDPRLVAGEGPPLPAGPAAWSSLRDLIARADLVITW